MRKHYFDNGKAFASLLGILFHTSLVFVSTDWLITVGGNKRIDSLSLYTDYINLFRMPLFLFISGYFAMYGIKKYKIPDFIKSRLLRLGIPLGVTMMTFNVLQTYYVNLANNRKLNFLELASSVLPWNANFTLSHLWFLYYVILFSIILIPISRLISVFFERYAANNCFLNDFILINVNIFIFGLFMVVWKVFHINYSLLNSTFFAVYLPYFVFGSITFLFWENFRGVFIELKRKRVFFVLTALPSSLFLTWYISEKVVVLSYVFKIISRYYSLVLVLFLLFTFLNKTNKILRYLSESSYFVYLVHQPIIVILSFIYVTYFNEVNSMIGFVAILALSTILIFTVDYFINKRSRLLNRFYNGIKLSDFRQWKTNVICKYNSRIKGA